MRIHLITSLLFLFTISMSCVAQDAELPKLAKEIRNMRDTDQKLRIKWAKLAKEGDRESKKFKKLTNQCIEADSLNTIRMKEIVATHGWPTYSLVGKRASNSAWLLVQHADRDPLFQMKCLPLLKEAVDAGEANPTNYAYLYDRVHVAQGKKQLYATQTSTNNGITTGEYYPIEDESKVQERRESMGIEMSVVEYAKQYGFEYTIPSEKEAEEKAIAYQKWYKQKVFEAKSALEINDYSKAAENYMKAMVNFGSLQNEDLVDTARAMSLSNHKDAHVAISYLMKAAINGWENISDFDSNPDFEYIKKESPRNWKNLMRTVGWLMNGE